jgi:AraC-like DNA-binding protein
MMRAYLGPDWRPRRVCFAHDAPADRSVHERVFGRNVDFGADFNGVICTRSDLERRNPNADPAMARYARQLLDAGFSRSMPGMAAQVRELIVMLLGTGRCTVDLVAQHLGVDRRTVHRQLAKESQTYSALLEEVRRELAVRYMKNRDRGLAEVSSLLGFSAPSGFSRWYRRQFHAAPSVRRAADHKTGQSSGRAVGRGRRAVS